MSKSLLEKYDFQGSSLSKSGKGINQQFMVLRRESKGIESIFKHDQVMVRHLAENKVKERLNLRLGKEKRIRAAIKGE